MSDTSSGSRTVRARKRKLQGKRGFVLVTMAVASIGLIGVIGMAVDVGRAFVAKNETQAFCDAASLAAALKLDGTSSGITNAKAAVTSSTNAWHMDSTSVPAPTVDFATSSSGPWVVTPSPASGYNYVRIQSTVSLPLFFVPVVTSWFTQTARYNQSVNTAAIAAQLPVTAFKRGLAPYTAVTTTPLAANFGLVLGNSGNKAAQAKALDLRVQQDAAYYEKTLTDYLADTHHSGRRLIALPVVDPINPTTTTVVGYASFLLQTDGAASTSYYQKQTGNQAFCAIYAGPYVQGSASGGAGGVGAYRVSLVQ